MCTVSVAAFRAGEGRFFPGARGKRRAGRRWLASVKRWWGKSRRPEFPDPSPVVPKPGIVG